MADNLEHLLRHSKKGCKVIEANDNLLKKLWSSYAPNPSYTPFRLGSPNSNNCLSEVDELCNAHKEAERRLRAAAIEAGKHSAEAIKCPTDAAKKKAAEEATAELDTELELFSQLVGHLSEQISLVEATGRLAAEPKLTIPPPARILPSVYDERELRPSEQNEVQGATAVEFAVPGASTTHFYCSSNFRLLQLTYLLHPAHVDRLISEVGPLLQTDLPKSYTFLGEFGRGGFGRVHQAKVVQTSAGGGGGAFARKDNSPFSGGSPRDELSALKVQKLSRKNVEDIIREVKFSGGELLRGHANILTARHCSLFRTLQPDGYYVALDFDPMADNSLEKYVSARLPEPQIARVMKEVLQGLSFIHSKGILHNDVKPGNILLNEGNVKIADFGRSTYLAEYSPMKSGSFCFIPPEVADAKLKGITSTSNKFTTAIDIWSLGATLYNLLENNFPFYQYESKILLDAITCTEFALSIDKNFSSEVKRLFSEMTRNDPVKRPSAESLLLNPFLEKACSKYALKAFIEQNK